MAIDKLIPQYLNSDTDQKLVKSVEMTDNLNVRVSNDAEGTEGVIKNVKGTEVVSAKSAQDAFPAGDNRVIGSVANEKNKEILFLVWNENDNHGIYRMDMTTGKYQKLYEDSVLNFKKYSYADCDVIVNEEEETLFYWTDNENPPMKVNVNRLISSDYPSSLYSGTDEEKLLCLTVAKQPPLKAPSYIVKNNPSLNGVSRIKNNNYQFAYKYVYTDGEHSALSPYSSVSIANSQLVDGFNTEAQKNFFNQIDVTGLNSVADVEKIVFYARRVGGQFFEISEVDNSFTNNSVTVEFSDNVLGSTLSNAERDKIYDNVPQLARAQSIAGDRLMYGSYVEGYGNLDTDVELISNYHKNPDVYDIDIVVSNSLTRAGRVFTLDYSSFPSQITNDSKVILNFHIDFENIHIIDAGGAAAIDLDKDNQELFIHYSNKSDNLDFATNKKNVESIKGSTVLSSILDAALVQMGLSSGFDPSITLSSEGVKIQEIIDIPASVGSPVLKSDIKNLISNRLSSKKHSMFLNPSNDEKRYSILAVSGTPFNVEMASFKGRLDCSISRTAINTDSDNYIISGESAELAIYEFLDGGGKPCNVLSTKKFVLGGGDEQFLFTNATVLEGGSSLFTSLVGDRSFKSGASHELGLVYYDDRGRTSGVQELGDIYINHLNDRANENSLDGKSSVVMRLKHNPPSWAKRWAPVYTGKGNIELKFQYGVKGAFIPSNNIEGTTVLSSKENIYVSLNSLFSKDGSYTKGSKALINYKFEEGDKIRIIKYGNNLRTTHEFVIVDYVTLTNDPESNPILEKLTENSLDATTGEFLVVKDNVNASGFNYDAVSENTSNWFLDCIIEVYRDVKDKDEDVYYEIGKSYSITSGQHDDERTSTSLSGTVVSNLNGVAKITNIDVKIFKGDVIQTGAGSLTVGNVYRDGSTYTAFALDRNVTPIPLASYTFTVTNTDSVIELSIGDVYHRIRNCITSNSQINTLTYTNLSSQNGVVEFIEDYSVSDFFKSKASSTGRPFAYLPNANTIRRESSITYSDAYVLDSDRLGLSSFNLSLSNWVDLGIREGSIQSMINRSDSLTVIQENKASQIPIGRNLIEYANGDSNITVSKNVLGIPSYYAGDYGTSNPESVVERFGVVYYVDARAGKVVRLSADGITPISEKGLDSFFQERFTEVMSSSYEARIVGGFDPDNGEYIVTIEPNYISSVTIGTDSYEVAMDPSDNVIAGNITYTSSTIIWNLVGSLWNTYCGNWNEAGNGVIFIDQLNLPQGILIDDELTGSTSDINVVLTDSDYSFSATVQINLSTGIITFPSTTCEGDSITVGTGEASNTGFTIAYKHKEGVWGSKYSFKPTSYVNINNELYSFLDAPTGLMWKHNSNETRNNFYGTQYDSMFEVVSNMNPSMIKVYEALGVEGDGTWSAVLSNSDQSTTISTSDFDNREGHRYAMIPRDTLVSTGHQIYLGKVEAVSGDTVTFTTPVNRLPFVVGDDLYTASGSTLTDTTMDIAGITDRKTIQCTSTVSGISAGDDIFVQHSARVDGDPMRGVFLKLKMTSSDTTPFEVHALSVSYDRSRLHNDRVN